MESEWVKLPEGVPPFMHISQNESSGKKQGKFKEDDIAVCECKYDASNSESACGENCLNVLTSTECTPGYCPCNEHCRNQTFQKCEYAKTKLFNTEGRGWGLLADQDMKAGQFIIEYCGEIISSEEAKQRSQTYETQGLKDAYIISLNANYFIDATKKGSLARFINHSCQPNCETRKWTVLGETRVGIFAKQDIPVGTELAYDYNFEWYGGATVRCLCGAANCSLFLGAKSHGFQEYNHVWEDGDDRYTVENVPLYDSAEDEHFPTIPFSAMENKASSAIKIEAASGVESHFSFSAQHVAAKSVETEMNEKREFGVEDGGQSFTPMMSRVRGNNIGPSGKRSQHTPKPQRAKTSGRKHATSKPFAQLFKSKKAQEEIRRCEELKNKATSELNVVYDEIRPTIEEHERDNQDSVPTSVADKWIKASCAQMSADFNLSFAILKNAIFPPNEEGPAPAGGPGDDKDETK